MSLGSDSYQLDFSAVASSPLKESLSDSFLPSYKSANASSPKNQGTLNQQASVSPTNDPWRSVPKNDPWQSGPKTSVTDIPDGTSLRTSSTTRESAWTPFNTSLVPNMQEKGNSHVTLDPWYSTNSNKRSSDPVSKKSTNPWANDVSEVNIAQSVAPTKTANANSQQNEVIQFDPLTSDWMTGDSISTVPKQDSSDLFGNWDTAVKQMHQMPAYGAPHMYNAWPQQNQVITMGQTFTTPSLI